MIDLEVLDRKGGYDGVRSKAGAPRVILCVSGVPGNR